MPSCGLGKWPVGSPDYKDAFTSLILFDLPELWANEHSNILCIHASLCAQEQYWIIWCFLSCSFIQLPSWNVFPHSPHKWGRFDLCFISLCFFKAVEFPNSRSQILHQKLLGFLLSRFSWLFSVIKLFSRLSSSDYNIDQILLLTNYILHGLSYSTFFCTYI